MSPRPPNSRDLPGWMKILAGGLVGALGLAAAVALQQAATARKAWPTVRATLARLATDEGARGIWRANPALRDDFRDEADFLATVQLWRDRVGPLPSREPEPGSGAWQRTAGPWSFQARVRGEGGAWVHLAVKGSTPLHPQVGEGLELLAFGTDPAHLGEALEAHRLRTLDADWQRLRGVASRLATPEGTRALWQAESSLQRSFPSPESLEARAARLRPRLQALPATAREAGPGLGHRRDPDHDVTAVTWVADGQAVLQAEWEKGTLTALLVP